MSDLRPTVYHLGRAGDVPGGMTQVVNAYLRWPFPQVYVDVIESRGDPGDHLAAARGFVRAMRKVHALKRARSPAVLVAHLSERGSFLREGTIARYASASGIPVVAHMHGSEFAAFEKARPQLVGTVLRSTVRVICLSEETRDICTRHVGPDRVDLVPNAIPSGTLAAKTKTVVFGGVVSHRKGIDVLQAAWRRIAPGDGWRLIVAGPIRDAELVDRSLAGVDFVGSLEHERLLTLLASASIAVLPSRDEAMPMFILEAMARRACVISTAVGGIPAVLSGRCGLLVSPGSVSELAGALHLAITDAEQRDQIAGRGFVRFEEQFSARAVYPRVESIWLKALR